MVVVEGDWFTWLKVTKVYAKGSFSRIQKWVDTISHWELQLLGGIIEEERQFATKIAKKKTITN